jgi:hypothetical protein
MKLLLVFLALAAPFAGPATTFAQSHTYARMSFSVSQVYDGNLFATPASRGPQDDLISRAGPSIEVGYLSLPLDIVARYGIQAERYLNHPDMNATAAHQDASVRFSYLPMPRLDINVDAGYVATQSPAEFNLESQLAVGRAPAQRLALSSAVSYDWNPVTKINGDYTFGRDNVVGGVASVTGRSRVGLQRRTGLRNAYRVDYQFRNAGFSDGSSSRSHVVTAGWTHAITTRTGFEVAAGPRLTAGSVRPEVSAVLRRQLTRGELSAMYSSTEMTTIGERGTINVDRVGFSGSYRPARRLVVTATPSWSRSTRGHEQVPVYVLDVESAFETTGHLSLVAWARVGRQDGILSGPPEMIPYRTLGLNVMIAQPRRHAGDAGSATR